MFPFSADPCIAVFNSAVAKILHHSTVEQPPLESCLLKIRRTFGKLTIELAQQYVMATATLWEARGLMKISQIASDRRRTG
jgi:hypothetical protein